MAIFENIIEVKNDLDKETEVVTKENSIQTKKLFGISFFRKHYIRNTNIDKTKSDPKLGFAKPK